MLSNQLIGWVGRHILPHEGRLRAWLSASFPSIDVDDVVQESYCRLAGLHSFDHIADPKNYLFRTARNVVLEQIRRERVVSIEAATGLAEFDLAQSEGRSPEDTTADRRMLARIEALINVLPDRARTVFRMRKIEGISQREVAERLGISEMVVENEIARGLRRILDQLTESEKSELPIRRRSTAGETSQSGKKR